MQQELHQADYIAEVAEASSPDEPFLFCASYGSCSICRTVDLVHRFRLSVYFSGLFLPDVLLRFLQYVTTFRVLCWGRDCLVGESPLVQQ